MSNSKQTAALPIQSTNHIKKNQTANLILLLCALIWGLAFAAQKGGMDHIGPYLFIAFRFSLAAFTMFCALWIQRLVWQYGGPLLSKLFHEGAEAPRIMPTKRELKAGAFLAFFFTCGVFTQQVGLVYTTVGNSAFITGLYVILVPVLALAYGKRLHFSFMVAAFLSLAALYLLCIPANATLSLSDLNQGDVLTLFCALAWTFHVFYVAIVGHWGGILRIALLQFLFCAIAAWVAVFFLEWKILATLSLANVPWFPLFFTGVISGGLAFFLQIYGQKNASASAAAIILSAEALFGALAGWWFLGEIITERSMYGGALMIIAMVLAQWHSVENVNSEVKS